MKCAGNRIGGNYGDCKCPDNTYDQGTATCQSKKKK